MRRPPPPHPRGVPRTPGSGRKRGTPNRKTVELRELMGCLVADIDYQARLKRAFTTRRLHPGTEQRIWDYALGRPMAQVEARLSMDTSLDVERELLRSLSLPQLQELAAQSQALMDKATAMATENTRKARMFVAVSPSPIADAQVAASGKLPGQPSWSRTSRAILSVAARDDVEG
jgi:hypothetical protein